MMEYTIIRSKRKTLALHIRNGALKARAPMKTPKCNIDKFIAAKENWIAKKLVYPAEQIRSRMNF